MYGDTWNGPLYDWPDYGVCRDNPEAITHIRKCYAALLTMTDHWLGRLWDTLDAQGAWRDTMVVLTTDHGSMLGEHEYWMKNAMPVYNEITHIPLIIHLPGSQRAGSHVATLTQTTDIMPTFLDYFGAAPPPYLHGTSLRPALEADQAVHDAIIYGYFGMALNATDGRWTYFRNPVAAETKMYAYTAMPTSFHSFMSRDELAQAEMGRFLGHTYNIPVYKVPQTGKPPLRHDATGAYMPQHELFDLMTDPAQEHPLDDPEQERHFCDLLRTHLDRVHAPEGHLERLGL
jgi:arylsulfatase A-like enzyme